MVQNVKRRELREHIFKLLFRVEFHKEDSMPEQKQLYIEELEALIYLNPEDREYIEKKYEEIAGQLESIDESINQVVQGWTTRRMGKVDLTIIRLAVYEMKYDDSVPINVAINEAVELSKKFGGEESSAFVNGVLAKLV